MCDGRATRGWRTSPRRDNAMVAVVAAAVLGGTSAATAQCQYTVTSLDYPIDCAFSNVITIARGLNNHGAVVGRYRCPTANNVLAFLWTPEEGFMTLPLPPGVNDMRADDINDAGLIVGSYSLPAGGGSVAFVYQDGQYTVLEPPPGSCWIRAVAINNDGMVAGSHTLSCKSPSQPSAYVWTADEGFTYLGVMNGPYSQAGYIGPGGQVTGWTGTIVDKRGFIWHDGELTILPPIPGGVTSSAGAITAQGIVTGEGWMQEFPPAFVTGFIWRDGTFRLIEPVAGYDTSPTARINAVRQVTGFSLQYENPNLRRGYLWQHGVTHNLTDLVVPGMLYIESAGAINDQGQILASGLSGHAFLLTPVSRPVADIDIDCAVGITDFLWVLGEWGRPDSPADVNEDGSVDELDLITVIENWGA